MNEITSMEMESVVVLKNKAVFETWKLGKQKTRHKILQDIKMYANTYASREFKR